MDVCSDCKGDSYVDCIVSYSVINVPSITLNGIFSLKTDEGLGYPGAIAGHARTLTRTSRG